MSETTKHAGGRPPYQPSEKERGQVKTLAGVGVSHNDIAKVLQIAPATLRTHFWQELEIGSIEANAKVAACLFQTATEGSGKERVTAQIFWLKARAGWRDGGEPEGGKKAAVEAAAKTAQQGTDWESLLN